MSIPHLLNNISTSVRESGRLQLRRTVYARKRELFDSNFLEEEMKELMDFPEANSFIQNT